MVRDDETTVEDTLVELPGNNNRIFAVNPLRVTGVQPYDGPLAGREGMHPLSVVWVDGRTLFVCAWRPEITIATLNAAKSAIARAFEAGARYGYDRITPPNAADLAAAFEEFVQGGL